MSISAMQKKWEELHQRARFRPKYPAESVVQFVLRNFKRDKQNKILDLGCGAGRHVCFLAEENFDTFGTDISKDGLAYTQEVLSRKKLQATLKVGSVSDIPFADEHFDGIICYAVLYYCKAQEIKKAVDEIYRVLKPGGLVYLEVRNTDDYRYGKGEKIEDNTFIICEDNVKKCAYNESGMVMHFFLEEEIRQLFKCFSSVMIDRICESHENGQYFDNNFKIVLEK
jgi:ubiquinone/menaquinone biosynthesis C-methylase UbiE